MSRWLILWCEEDFSYSLVRDCELICDQEHLRIGDVVTFFYDRKEYQGIVREMAGDCDYDRLVQRLSELNASNKAKESSFHVELPRKCTQKSKNSVTNSKSKTSQASKNPASSSKRKDRDSSTGMGSNKRCKPLAPVKQATPLSKLLAVDIYSDGDSDNSSDCSRSPPSSPKPEEISKELMHKNLEVKRQSQSKNSMHDISLLNSFRSKKFDSPPSDSKTRSIDRNFHSTAASPLVNNNHFNDKGEEKETSDIPEVTDDDFDSTVCISERDPKGSPSNSSCSSHGHTSDITSTGTVGKKSLAFSFCNFTSDQREKNIDTTFNSDCGLPSYSGNSSQSGHGLGSPKTPSNREDELIHNPFKKPPRKVRSNDDKPNKSAQGGHSNDEHETPRRVSLFGHGRGQTGKNSRIGPDNIGEDQRSANHGVDIFGESDNDELDDSTRKKPRAKKLKPSQPAIPFAGKMFRREKDDPDVVALKGADGKNVIYINSCDLKTARAAGNAKVFVRNLMGGVFNDEALYQCTLAGGEYRAGGKSQIKRKPQLDQVAVNVILDVAIGRQKSKEWKPAHDKDKLKATMRQKLVDLRPKLKRMFEDTNAG